MGSKQIFSAQLHFLFILIKFFQKVVTGGYLCQRTTGYFLNSLYFIIQMSKEQSRKIQKSILLLLCYFKNLIFQYFFHYDFIILIDFLSRFISYFDIDHNNNYIIFISFLLRNFSQMMKHYIERVVDCLPLMTYGLMLSLKARI